ncbi:T9SS type A sorting domain-containing protein [bacterium]|nr:T9SS type A sorting domain-containing protein [bacterium]
MRNCRIVFVAFIVLLHFNTSNSTILHIPLDYETIQDAVDSSLAGDTLLLAEGLYTEHVDVTEHGLTIGSHFILDGDTTHIAQTRWTAPEGETALHYQLTNQDQIRLLGVQLENCNREDNEEVPYGGGICSVGGTSNVVVSDCIFEGNRSRLGGGAYLNGNQVTVKNCTFFQNSASVVGGGLVVNSSTSTLLNNRFIANNSWDAGGCELISSATAVVRNNQFLENSSTHVAGGIRVFHTGELYIEYNDLRQNRSGQGGGLVIADTDAIMVTSNRFSGNCATVGDLNDQLGSGGGISLVVNETVANIRKNLLTDNTADNSAAAIRISSTTILTENVIRNNSGGFSILATASTNGLQTAATGSNNLFTNNQDTNNPDVSYFCVKSGRGTSLELTSSDFIGNGLAAGLDNQGMGDIDVNMCYWGHESGPYHEVVNPDGQGDTISVHVELESWSETPFTNFQHPSEFSLLSPQDGFTTFEPVNFHWEESTDPNPGDSLGYWLEISTNPEFDPDVTRKWKLGTTDHLDNLDLEIGEYYWRVRCLDPLWLETLSRETWHFEVVEQPPPPDPPVPFNLLAPEDGVTLNDSIIQFAWEASSIPNQIGDVSYTLMLLDDSNPPTGWTYETMSDTTLQVTLPNWEELTQWHVAAVNDSSDTTFSNQTWSFFATGVEDDASVLPESFHIVSIHPNPFNDHVTVSIALPKLTEVKFHVVDVLGRLVVQPSKRTFTAGFHDLTLHLPRAAGTYFLVITGPEGNISRHRLILVK